MIKDKSTLINILLAVLFGLFTLNSVLHHEVWADEAQVWLLVKNLSVPGLLKHLVNEGHPSFFYLLAMPFAKMNFSIMAMKIICWLGTVLGVFMIFQFSPFSKFAKFSIITGAGFLYFFPVIARSYSILPFLVTLAAYLYTKNKKHPFLYALTLCMIANTHVIMFAFAGILGIIFLYDNLIKPFKELTIEEKKINIAAFAVIALGLSAVVLQLYGTFGSNEAISFSFANFPNYFRLIMIQFFMNIIDYTVVKTHAIYGMALYGGLALVILFVLSLVCLLLTNIRAFFIAFFGIGFQLMIYIVSYSSYIYPTRIACAYLILIFAFWITLSDENFREKFKFFNKKTMNILLALMFFLTMLNGLRFTVLDLLNNYSSTKDTAEFIQKNIGENAFIITNNDPFSLGLYYYLPEKKIFSYMKRDYIKYIEWDESLNLTFERKNWSQVIRKEFLKSNKDKDIYVIVCSFKNFHPDYEIFSSSDFKLFYKSPPALADGEAFRIYKFIGSGVN